MPVASRIRFRFSPPQCKQRTRLRKSCLLESILRESFPWRPALADDATNVLVRKSHIQLAAPLSHPECEASNVHWPNVWLSRVLGLEDLRPTLAENHLRTGAMMSLATTENKVACPASRERNLSSMCLFCAFLGALSDPLYHAQT